MKIASISVAYICVLHYRGRPLDLLLQKESGQLSFKLYQASQIAQHFPEDPQHESE